MIFFWGGGANKSYYPHQPRLQMSSTLKLPRPRFFLLFKISLIAYASMSENPLSEVGVWGGQVAPLVPPPPPPIATLVLDGPLLTWKNNY